MIPSGTNSPSAEVSTQ